jgi:hypothetical protein
MSASISARLAFVHVSGLRASRTLIRHATRGYCCDELLSDRDLGLKLRRANCQLFKLVLTLFKMVLTH